MLSFKFYSMCTYACAKLNSCIMGKVLIVSDFCREIESDSQWHTQALSSQPTVPKRHHSQPQQRLLARTHPKKSRSTTQIKPRRRQRRPCPVLGTFNSQWSFQLYKDSDVFESFDFLRSYLACIVNLEIMTSYSIFEFLEFSSEIVNECYHAKQMVNFKKSRKIQDHNRRFFSSIFRGTNCKYHNKLFVN